MFSKIRADFLTGALILIPLVVTIWVLYFIIDRLNFLLLEPIVSVLRNWVPTENLEALTKTSIFVLLLIFLTLVGFAARIIIIRNIFGFGERILFRVPMISTIYKAIKEISFAFFVQKNSIFQKVVLVEYPRKGLYQLGFITSETKGEAQEKTKETVINVFIPTTPNPTSGILALVPKEDIIYLNMSVSEGMKMVISGGAVVPKAYYGDTKDRRGASEKEGPERD